jgi:hypothetical protein
VSKALILQYSHGETETMGRTVMKQQCQHNRNTTTLFNALDPQDNLERYVIWWLPRPSGNFHNFKLEVCM